nr:response regulator transcription factor [Lysinibacter cavernae]
MIVDDQEMIRAGLRTIIDTHPELTVAAEAGDGITALHELASTDIDVVLMDIRMPGIDGVETTKRMRATHPASALRILVLTTFDQDENVLSAIRAGADGFLSKGASAAELTSGILSVAAGEHALSSTAVSALIGHALEPQQAPVDPEAAARFAELTEREGEVVRLVVSGLSNPEIAALLFLSPFTVKTHVNRAMMKSGVASRAQLVSIAIKAGFGDPA